MPENYGALGAFNEQGQLNIPTQAAADYIAKQGQVTASQPQDDSWLSAVLSMNQKLGSGIIDVGQGLVHGATVGAANINKLIPGATWLGRQADDALRYVGVDPVVPEPKSTAGGLASGVGQALPGIIPAVKALRVAGWAPLAADVLGGFIGDFAASSKKDAKGITDLIGMIPGESSKEVSKALNDFIKSDNASFEDLKARMFAALPGVVFTPVVNGLVRYAMKFKNNLATDNFTGTLRKPPVEEEAIPIGFTPDQPKQLGALPKPPEAEPIAVPAIDLSPEGFFSAMSRAVDALPMEKGGGAQMRAMIAKGEGVKAEEMAWTGLDEFLKGKKSVTKAEIKEFTDANQVRVEEVTKRMDGVTGARDEAYEFDDGVVDDAYDAYSHRAEEIAFDLPGGEGYHLEDILLNLQKLRPTEYPEIDSSWANRLRDHFEGGGELADLPEQTYSDILDAIDNVAKAEYLDSPYFSVQSADGRYEIYGNDDIGYSVTRRDGSSVNSSEVYNLEEAKIQAYTDALDYGHVGHPSRGDTLFEEWTLPDGENYREVLLTLPNKSLPPELQGNAFAKTHGYDPDKVLNVNTPEHSHWKRAIEEAGQDSSQRNYLGGHFDEDNVLAHIRLNDRTGPNGEKILFVEEIQSDWHQKGRKQGYKTPVPQMDEATQARFDQYKKYRSLYYDARMGKSESIKGGDPGLTKEYEALENEFEQYIGNAGQVPDAPLKKTWQETSLRRVIRMAAEEGYDSVAWTPGKIQAERYGLSKQLDTVRIEKLRDGTKAGQYYVTGEKDGRGSGFGETVTEEKLSELVGKDLAEKAIKDAVEYPDGRSYSGLDLELGGEGMEGFYDKELVNYAKKFGKKFDAKVGTTQIGGRIVRPERRSFMLRDPDEPDSGLGNFATREEADQWRATTARDEVRDWPVVENITPAQYSSDAKEVWTIPITPKMRESVMKKGVPLFGVAGLAATAGMQGQDRNGL